MAQQMSSIMANTDEYSRRSRYSNTSTTPRSTMEVAIAPKSQPVIVQSQLAIVTFSTVTTESAASMPSCPALSAAA